MLRRLMNFQGRIGRRALALMQLPIVAVALPLFLLATHVTEHPDVLQGSNAGVIGLALIVLTLLMLPMVWLSYSQAAKRFHDLDKSGWVALIFLVPYVSFAATVYLLFARGNPEANQFGPPDNG